MKDGILCRKVLSVIGQNRLCPVVPESLQLKVLQGFHDSVTGGHQGTRNTVAKLREWYFWEGMWKSVDRYVRSCLSCLRNNIVRTAPMGEMIPLPSTCLPGEILSIDTMTDLTRTAKGHTALFVCTDRATRCVWAMPAYNKEARHAVKLLKRVMYQLGIPREVLTDGGREYDNSLFIDVCQDMGIRHAQTSRYHPQSNGQTERMNASLMQALRKYVRRDRNWDEHVEAVVYALNTSPNSHTQICPYSLLYGMTPPSPVRHESDQGRPRDNDWYAMKVIEELREVASERLAAEQREYKRKHDQRISKHDFQTGQMVMLKRHVPEKDKCRKLSARYAGPYEILEVHQNNTVTLRCEDQRRHSDRVNVGELKHCVIRDPVNRGRTVWKLELKFCEKKQRDVSAFKPQN